MRADPSRREFLAAGAAGAVGLGLGGGVAEGAGVGRKAPGPAGEAAAAGSGDGAAPGPMATDSRTAPEAPFRLGVASFSLRNFSRAYAIRAIQSLGTPYVNIKSFHQPYESTPEQLQQGRADFESVGLEIVGGGTITLNVDTDDDVRFYFEYAKASGMPLMVIAPTRQTLPRIERFVVEYGIAVAIHNHGPEDPHFPGPQDILPVVKDMDPRVGVCLDVGHTARTGLDVAEAAEMCGARLLDMHMKDLADLGARDSQCIVGEGAIPVARLFDVLTRMEYRGYVNLEYEIDPFDPLPGMHRSFAYLRGVLAGLGA